MSQISVRKIYDRLKQLHRLDYDTDLVTVLGISRRSVEQYRNRGSIPFRYLAAYVSQTGVSFDWLLFGDGSQYLVKEPGGPYRINPAEQEEQLAAAMAAVFDIVQERGIALDGARFSRIVRLLARDMSKGQKLPDKQTLEDIIRLVE